MSLPNFDVLSNMRIQKILAYCGVSIVAVFWFISSSHAQPIPEYNTATYFLQEFYTA